MKQKELHSPSDHSRGSSYEKPKLQKFGDVAELTRAIGNMGNKDGGMGKAHGTSI